MDTDTAIFVVIGIAVVLVAVAYFAFSREPRR